MSYGDGESLPWVGEASDLLGLGGILNCPLGREKSLEMARGRPTVLRQVSF